MNLSQLILWIALAFCLALTAGGILLLFQSKRLNVIGAFKYLQYSLILIYTFGFYALWSNIFLPKLPISIQPLTLEFIERAVFIMGTPFLFFGLLLQLAWAYHCILPSSSKKIIAFVIVPVGLVSVLVYHLQNVDWSLASAYSSAAILISFSTLLIFLIGKSEIVRGKWKALMLLALLMCAGIYAGNFQTLLTGDYYRLLFVFLFFLSHTSAAVIFIYTARIDESAGLLSFDDFVQKYQITRREAEIVREIYNGKSNQEIADFLFVTLQTVKDHTSRIYQKAQVKSRVQIIGLLRKFNGIK